MATFKFTWERLGRGTPPPPTFVDIDPEPIVTLADRLAEQAYEIARPRLISRDVEASVDLPASWAVNTHTSTLTLSLDQSAAGLVNVTAGFHHVGQGLVVVVPDDTPESVS